MDISKNILLLLLLTAFSAEAQVSIRVIDAITKEPLIGANIVCNDTSDYRIFTTDVFGNAQIEKSCAPYTVSYLGYTTSVSSDTLVLMDPSHQVLDQMIITGSRYQRRLSETTVSVDVITSQLLKSVNTSKVDQILDKLPGVQVVGGQANIRGGSGFSYGAGSRVMVLLDDLPALQTDAGFANWGDLPVELIDQVEVLKGAASSLYGSAALNGIVNFRRKRPTSKPRTDAFSAITTYLSPADRRMKWWDQPYIPYRWINGVSDVRKIGNLDLTSHGFYANTQSYNQDNYERRGRLGVNASLLINKKWSAGINTLYNHNTAQDFFLWFDDLRGAYKPFNGTLSSGTRDRLMIDPHITYIDNNTNRHRLQTRYFYVNNRNSDSRSNQSHSYFGEYQWQRRFTPQNLTMTGGLSSNFTRSDSELFGDTLITFLNIGAYIQGEKEWEDIVFAFGTRYESNQVKSPQNVANVVIPNGEVVEDALVNRLGINYKFRPHTNIRASWGQGYRYPTISERFVSTSFGGFNVYPNPLLTSERGWTSELGIKQGVSIKGWKGYVDLSAFLSRYQDMIEFIFLADPLGFQPINVGNTQIPGFEISVAGNKSVGALQLTTLAGYTYIDPTYLNFDNRSIIRDNLSSTANVLKYRSRHSVKIDQEASWNKYSLGISWQYYSHVINIDKRLEETFDGTDYLRIKSFRDRNDSGYHIIDVRAAYNIAPFKISAILANAFNAIYAVRPGQMDPPRNVTLRVDLSL